MTTKTQSLAKYPADQIVSSKIVANNTFEIVGPFKDRTIRLHYTDIVIFRPDGSIMLDSGGWRTLTTRERINRFLPDGMHVYTSDGFWYISYRPDGYVDYDSGAWTVPYHDGMVIPADYSKPDVDSEDHAEKRRLKRLIDKMCRKANELARDKMLPVPEAGDCWLCMIESGEDMRTSDANPLRNLEHIVAHLEEQYLHGRLIYNAYRWAGYRDEQMRYVYGMRVGQILRRYLKARVGLSS